MICMHHIILVSECRARWGMLRDDVIRRTNYPTTTRELNGRRRPINGEATRVSDRC